MSQKESIAKAPERRVRRTPVGQRHVLTVSGKEPGYEYRFVNDSGDRVQTFLDNGWETVPSKGVRVGDKRIGTPGTDGSIAKASVGQGITGVLLRIKDEWYAEDQAAKQAHVAATEAATREKALDGTYGKLDISRE
jgi:hypothetical protein